MFKENIWKGYERKLKKHTHGKKKESKHWFKSSSLVYVPALVYQPQFFWNSPASVNVLASYGHATGTDSAVIYNFRR